MYVANTTRQRLLLQVRPPELNRPVIADIPSGTQVEVGKTWNPNQIDSVVAQLVAYGARDASDMRSGEIKSFSGIVFHLSKPVSTSHIENAHADVQAAAQIRSQQELTKDVIALDRSVANQARNRKRPRRTTLQVSQVASPFEHSGKEQPSFTASVDPDGHDEPAL